MLDAKDTLPGFRFQSGLTSWPFLNMKTKNQCIEIDEARKQEDAPSDLTYFTEYTNFMDIPENQRAQIRDTMFYTHYDAATLAELPKCLRVMPHHQNTSGFFITVIEKIAELDGAAPVLETEDKSAVKPPMKI